VGPEDDELAALFKFVRESSEQAAVSALQIDQTQVDFNFHPGVSSATLNPILKLLPA
jgi:hypothetical protein